jgi:lariat debranching enzyme
VVESNESSSQPGNTLDEDIELPDEDDDAADDDE